MPLLLSTRWVWDHCATITVFQMGLDHCATLTVYQMGMRPLCHSYCIPDGYETNVALLLYSSRWVETTVPLLLYSRWVWDQCATLTVFQMGRDHCATLPASKKYWHDLPPYRLVGWLTEYPPPPPDSGGTTVFLAKIFRRDINDGPCQNIPPPTPLSPYIHNLLFPQDVPFSRCAIFQYFHECKIKNYFKMATLWWFRSHVFHLEFPPEWKTPDIGKKTSRGGGYALCNPLVHSHWLNMLPDPF